MESRIPVFTALRHIATAVLLLGCINGVQAQDRGGIKGVVLNSAGDLALDADVRLIGTGRLVAVDETATFSFEDIRGGPYILEAMSLRYGRCTHEVFVDEGQITEVALEVLTHVGMDEVVISSGPVEMTLSDAVRPADALSFQDLVDASAASLGESVKGKVGITSTYFGPGASRPVIRGVGGNRVSILQQSLTVADASDVSPDHAPAVEALLAERIEFVRGPATLLYGSNAIGGVVNVRDGRIPEEMPTQELSGTVTGRLNTVARGRTGALKLNGARGNLAWTAAGLTRSTQDFRVPEGSILKDDDHDHDHGDHDDHGHDDHDHTHDTTIPHSSVSLTSGFGGVSYVGSWGFIGAAVGLHTTEYGVPGHGTHMHDDDDDDHDHDDDHGDEGVFVDMNKLNFDFEAHWRANQEFLHSVRLRAGITDYEHEELEHDAVFKNIQNDVMEARLEVDHALARGVHGIAGFQMDHRELGLSGIEAYMPSTETSRIALFALERFDVGAFGLEAGLRYERARISPETGKERTFGAFSVGTGINYAFSHVFTVALRTARNVKIPHPGELYSDGHHVGTQAYEIGNEDLNVEVALSVDASVHVHHEELEATASVFFNQFTDFIYAKHTSERKDGDPVYRVAQGEARFAGFEIEAEGELLRFGENLVGLRVWSDLTYAERTDEDEPLPRIPPLRAGGEMTYERGPAQLALSVKAVGAQNRVEDYETTTDGYFDLGASFQYKFFPGRMVHVVTLQGRNLTNAIQRSHTSFLKQLLPLPGRDIRLTYRMLF